jgi:PHD/YefM family antitoxin component YafN of YafNO toxin-antitoxin module
VKTIDVNDATLPLADYAPGVRTERLVITDHGTPTAVMLPVDHADLESIALSTNPALMALIERSRSRARQEGGISAEEMRRRVLDQR